MHSSVAKLPEPPESLESQAASALQQGEIKASLTLLMEAYGDEIYRHCRHVVGDDGMAADVQQTVFVQAYRDQPRFQARSSVRTWLYAIARNRCLDAIKIQKRRQWRFRLGLVTREQPDLGPDVPTRLHSQALGAALDRALATLKPEVRIAVLLRYRDSMSYDEMAQVCGAAPATLQARVTRALPKLKKALEKYGGEL